MISIPRSTGRPKRGCFRSISCRLRWPTTALVLLVLGFNPASARELSEAVAGKTFDQVWNQVRQQYFDYPRIAEDWEEARTRLRPEALAAESQSELRSVLTTLLEGVGESHFGILAGDRQARIEQVGTSSKAQDAQVRKSQSSATGISLRIVDDQLLVSRTDGDHAEGIAAGWELTAIDDEPISPLLDEISQIEDPYNRQRSHLMLEVAVNSRVNFLAADEALSLAFRDLEGQPHRVSLEPGSEDVETIELGNLPPLPFQFRSRQIPLAEGCVGVIEFSTWTPNLMDRFLAVRDELLACEGLIIDLRGNLGGVLTTMVPLTAHLVSSPVLLGSLVRSDGQIDFRVFPRRVADDGSRISPFDGPVAILIDGLSASTSEMFTSGMQAAGLARVFGQRSPGMALPAQMLPLANGDRLMYAFADYADGEGRRIEGIGVTPDEAVHSTRETLISGQDQTLDAALNWIIEQHGARS